MLSPFVPSATHGPERSEGVQGKLREASPHFLLIAAKRMQGFFASFRMTRRLALVPPR